MSVENVEFGLKKNMCRHGKNLLCLMIFSLKTTGINIFFYLSDATCVYQMIYLGILLERRFCATVSQSMLFSRKAFY